MPLKKVRLLFFTSANREYEIFVLPYIFFALKYNNDAFVEVCVEDDKKFNQTNSQAIAYLTRLFEGKFLIRSANFTNILPHAVRFIEKPITEAEYVYIGDIDILIFEQNIIDHHLNNMAAKNIPFSNIIRKDSFFTTQPRLSGLHFAPYKLQYPLPNIQDLQELFLPGKVNGRDEKLLYQIMLRKGFMIPLSATYRPIHGIHISPSRHPISTRLGWGTEMPQTEYSHIFRDDEFIRLLPLLPIEIRNLFYVLDNFIHNNMDKFKVLCLNLATEGPLGSAPPSYIISLNQSFAALRKLKYSFTSIVLKIAESKRKLFRIPFSDKKDSPTKLELFGSSRK